MTAAAPPLTLNDLIRHSGIAPSDVLVFRHRPSEQRLNAVFASLVTERPDLFDYYQSIHGPRTEAALAKAKYLASFIGHAPGKALFAGLYEAASSRQISLADCVNHPLQRELVSLGMNEVASDDGRSALQFVLPLTSWHEKWRGRLVIRWKGLERSWFRWADRNDFEIEAIAQESLFARAMPSWDEMAIPWNELALLPSGWAERLRQWRGIYLITDRSDGKQYVGSAYGSENILQRWFGYARTGHGGNKLLRQRDQNNFQFSILQRVSPDMPDIDVIAIERSWKIRLRTQAPHGLNSN